jgi:hypothetical protein
MRATLIIIFALLATASFAREDLPDDIKYIESDAAVNSETRLMLANAFDTQSFENVLGSTVICGPALWDSIKAHPILNGVKLTDASFNIPITSGANAGSVQVLKGSLFQTPNEIRILSDILRSLPTNTINVRKINAHEASIYWALIPYDIEEPIFVVEYGELHFLLDINQTDNKVFWIDEVSKYRKGQPER